MSSFCKRMELLGLSGQGVEPLTLRRRYDLIVGAVYDQQRNVELSNLLFIVESVQREKRRREKWKIGVSRLPSGQRLVTIPSPAGCISAFVR